MRKLILALLLSALMLSCESTEENLEQRFKPDSGTIFHTVLLKAKADLSNEERLKLINLLDSLAEIPQTKDLLVTERASTGDKRAITNYDYALQMAFTSQNDLLTYAKHPVHLRVKKQIKPMLAGVPMVLDNTTR